MPNNIKNITLNDKYEIRKGKIFVTGTQALVKLPMIQKEIDSINNIKTSCFISGYRGSPLGAYDRELWKAKPYLKSNNIEFSPGLNEDLAATAVWGSQQPGLISESIVDGVFSIWYGKGPGVDRSGDAFKHGNSAGSSKNGGVLVLLGDDHTAKSSTLAHQSEFAMIDAQIPVLNPSNIQELIDYGLLAWKMSRYSGLWVSMKCITATVDSSASINISPYLTNGSKINSSYKKNVHIRWPDDILAQEERITKIKIPAVLEFAKAHNLNKPIWNQGKKKLGIIATGKAYNDLRQCFVDLEINEEVAKSLGIHLFKVGMSWPLEPSSLINFCSGMNEILVIEEKRSLVESQTRDILYNTQYRPLRIIGKKDENNLDLITEDNEIKVDDLSIVISNRITKNCILPKSESKINIIKNYTKDKVKIDGIDERIPYFCSGCPHNTSTKIPSGSKAMAGIGCHFMAAWMNRDTALYTHMGAEGTNWIGMSSFVKTKHIFQNIGDGTYNHSGLLAIRASVAAKVNITYKILYNDAVALTGGQPIDGMPTPASISHQLYGEGVKKIVVVSDDITKYSVQDNFSIGTTFYHRSKLNSVQKDLIERTGVTVIIYDQTCATEKRRRRKRGIINEPNKRLFINDLVCEGCGDCSKASNCVSIEPYETKFGRKRKINQSTCNKDYSCADGFCPSFVSIINGKIKKQDKNTVYLSKKDLELIPNPIKSNLKEPYNILVAGIGGTGVVTIGALIGIAAHIENKGISILDKVGLAQKGGAVVSHIRIAKDPSDIFAVNISKRSVNFLLGCDMVTASSSAVRELMNPSKTISIINDHETPIAESVLNRDYSFNAKRTREIINEYSLDSEFFNASEIATKMFGDSIASNLFLTGYAIQKGLIPIKPSSLLKAINLNGTFIEMNINAFNWGRVAAYDITLLNKKIGNQKLKEEVLFNLATYIEEKSKDLTKYQNDKYSRIYKNQINKIIVLDNYKGNKGLSEVAAKNLYKLMAYKDEYEVARLYTDGRFKKYLESTFEEGYQIKFHLSPPLLSPTNLETGNKEKITLSGKFIMLFKFLKLFKFLRGSVFDPFGHTQERKTERLLIKNYILLIDEVVNSVNKNNYSIALQILSIPNMIRGYGHVKIESIREADISRKKLLQLFRNKNIKDNIAAE